MASGVDARLSPGGHSLSFDTARAYISEANAVNGSHAQVEIVSGDPDRLDARSVEHTRQSRLQRWQEQRP